MGLPWNIYVSGVSLVVISISWTVLINEFNMYIGCAAFRLIYPGVLIFHVSIHTDAASSFTCDANGVQPLFLPPFMWQHACIH